WDVAASACCPPYAEPSTAPSVLQLILQGRAFAHFGTSLVLLKVGLVVDDRLQDHLFRNFLLAQASRRDLDAEAANDKTVEFPGGEHLVGLDQVDRLLAAVDSDHPALAVAPFQSLDGGGRHRIVCGQHAVDLRKLPDPAFHSVLGRLALVAA